MHYIEVYKELLKLVDIGHEKMKTASMDFLFIEILKREVDKFHLRLIELKEAGKITAIICYEYIVNLHQKIQTFATNLLNNINN